MLSNRRSLCYPVLLLPLVAGACAAPPQPASLAVLQPVYCYQTLADVACYARPDRGREGQLTGVYLRDPRDPGWPDLWLQAGAFFPP